MRTAIGRCVFFLRGADCGNWSIDGMGADRGGRDRNHSGGRATTGRHRELAELRRALARGTAGRCSPQQSRETVGQIEEQGPIRPRDSTRSTARKPCERLAGILR